MAEHPLEGMRSKRPLGWHIESAFYHVDQVLGYVTLKLGPRELAAIEPACLEIFGKLMDLKAAVERVIPKDDM